MPLVAVFVALSGGGLGRAGGDTAISVVGPFSDPDERHSGLGDVVAVHIGATDPRAVGRDDYPDQTELLLISIRCLDLIDGFTDQTRQIPVVGVAGILPIGAGDNLLGDLDQQAVFWSVVSRQLLLDPADKQFDVLLMIDLVHVFLFRAMGLTTSYQYYICESILLSCDFFCHLQNKSAVVPK